MARAQSTPLRTALSRMFPTALLKRLALSTGTVRRRRRVDPVQLFWVVVLTLGSGRSRTFADLRRSYERVTGTQLSASSFYNRFTPAFTRFLKEVLEARVGEASSPEREDRSRLGGNPGCPLRRLYSHPAPRRSGLLLAGLPDESHLGGREDAHGPQCPGPGTAPDEDHLRAGARRPGSAGRPVGERPPPAVRPGVLPVCAVCRHPSARRLLSDPLEGQRQPDSAVPSSSVPWPSSGDRGIGTARDPFPASPLGLRCRGGDLLSAPKLRWQTQDGNAACPDRRPLG